MQKPKKDKRMLPTEEVASIARDIYVAALDEDDDALTVACNEWLALKGKREGPSLVGFSFHGRKQLLDVEVEVTARINCNDLIAQATAVSGNPPLPISKEETGKSAAVLLMGVEAAIEHATRKLIETAVYPDKKDTPKLHDTARRLASTTL
jgi:hypothetical protein